MYYALEQELLTWSVGVCEIINRKKEDLNK